MGKRKIEIEKLEDPNKRQVTFSKRRKGLFKKAADACFLCDAEIAVIVFSPAGKPYSFGHTSVDSLIDRYLSRSGPVSNGAEHSRLSREIHDLESEIKNEQQQKMNRGNRFWWEQIDPDEYDSVEKLQSVVDELEKLRNNVLRRVEKLPSRSTTGDRNETKASLLLTDEASTSDFVDQTFSGMVDDLEAPMVAELGKGDGGEDDEWSDVFAELLRDDIEILPAF
ncbi:hypothetical protein HHK36_020239 [Tetracentron sinense]|uniref:MADS-box domain-containing protein n=1 Tax=Tetracentron sinense TaxID=13715 RepID=A0A835DAS1_TETSI|nr:hypothetical protein HHK36_020239 [Tetracentron sinense]